MLSSTCCFWIKGPPSRQILILLRRTTSISAEYTQYAALDTGVCGAQDEDVPELEWLDAPPAEGLDAATKMLRSLGALDAEGRITPEGAHCSESCTLHV